MICDGRDAGGRATQEQLPSELDQQLVEQFGDLVVDIFRAVKVALIYRPSE